MYLTLTKDETMNQNRQLAHKIIELNEYIEKFSEIKPHLDQICEDIFIERVFINNDGCNDYLVRKCIGYLENHDIIVSWENKVK